MSNSFHRRSIRLKGYDYSQPGAYFITICALNHRELFGKRERDGIVLNFFGCIVQDEIMRLPLRFFNVFVISYCIMPDHVHLLVEIRNGRNIRAGEGACRGTTVVQSEPIIGVKVEQSQIKEKLDRCAPTMQFGKIPSGTIPAIVRTLKASVSWRLRRSKQLCGQKIWQRNYYEHIIRTQKELEQVFAYIDANPVEKL